MKFQSLAQGIKFLFLKHIKLGFHNLNKMYNFILQF
jgi:hypothetical protein